ncbi:MAG: arylsulfatase [Cyclobacteriaceae bacterium]|nr:arylsulfatase [Cyclobacteriaceae bacterium]
MKKLIRTPLIFILMAMYSCQSTETPSQERLPNIVVIYADDLGYGDVGAYGATEIKTPNIDRLAMGGQRFTDGYASSATCSPSRYALLTGTYPWRNENAKILAGTAPLLIDTAQMTLAKMLRAQGYSTAVIGKWHLGLGNGDVNWNEHIAPGPNEVGFDYAFIMSATQDRVPTVYIKNGRVVNLDPSDPIMVDYNQNFEGEPTGLDNPELTTLKWHHGHNNSIVNGIPRIGFMKGGESAKWNDEEMADTFLNEAKKFVNEHQDRPFFLYYALQQPHVPRTPHTRFQGASGMGPRGDAIVEADWCLGELVKTLEDLGLAEHTMIIFSSDNGPVLNDGYYDDAIEKLGKHTPSGPLRGGKYSLFQAGTRVPFISYWPGNIEPGVSNALISQMDLMASFASLTKANIDATDSKNMLDVLMGKSDAGREALILEATSRTALRKGNWMMIPPYIGPAIVHDVNIEIGNDQQYQLYNLEEDIGEQHNLAASDSAMLKDMIATYKEIIGDNQPEIEQLELK